MRATAIGLVAIVLTITVAWTALNASADTSGPDPSGYTWTDSNAPDPTVTFDWIDISTTGTMITDWPGGNDDDGAWTQALPFPFTFFGNTYDAVQIGTNGFISFTIPAPITRLPEVSGASSQCNENWNDDSNGAGSLGNPIPHDDANCASDGWGFNPLIAGFFDDLDLGNCGEVYYGTSGSAPNRLFIVQWDEVCHNDSSEGGVTFEIILYEGSSAGTPGAAGASATNGEIKIQYADGFFAEDTPQWNNGASATTGLSFDGDTGLSYSFIQPVLTDGLAVLYGPASAPTTAPTATPVETEAPAPTASPTATPTATPPAGQTVEWGDSNCRDGVNPVDSLFVLRGDAGLPTDTGECPDMGQEIEVLNASPHVWGDVDCKDGMTPVDSLKTLRYDAGLSVSQDQPCPEVGQQVQVTSS